MTHGGRRLYLFVVALATLIPATTLRAADNEADDKPSWACLPEETVLLVRVPSGAKAAEQLAKTRLGALLTNSDRIDKVRAALPPDAASFPEQADKALGPYDLKLDDLKQLFEGEAGMAMILPDDGDSDAVVGIVWLEPGEDLAKRLVGAIDKLIDENDDISESVERTDIELAGQKVMQFEITPPRLKDDEDAEVPSVLVVRRGGRLILAGSFPIPDKGEKPDFEDSNEQLKEVFGRFLAAHEDDSGPKLRYEEAPGVAAALPSGSPMFEFMLDLEPILELAADRGGKEVSKVLEATGLDQLGLIVYRSAFERPIMKSGAFIAAPAPRSGILALLDQPPLTGKPPAWTPSSIISFSQASFDLGKAYSLIKQMAIDLGGDNIRPTFEQAEDRVNQILQADLATVLSSFGTRHSFVSFPPSRTAGGDADDVASAQEASAMVWETDEEDLWKRILQIGSAFAGKGLVDEQGFTGLRIDRPELSGGMFVGRGYLVLGIGGNAVESILSVLKNPPAGESGLSGSRLVQRVNDLLPPRDCLTYGIIDANRYVKDLRKVALVALNQDWPEDTIPPEVLELLKELLPDEDELNGALGVGGNQSWVDANGIAGKSILELPSN